MSKRKELSATALRRLVEERAGYRCEYCHAPQRVCGYRFHLDHIVPRARGGAHGPSNRALACASCNLAKIDRNLVTDPKTGDESALFNPRIQPWDDHFRWEDDQRSLGGRTPEGRATISALDMNSEMRREARQLWFDTRWLP